MLACALLGDGVMGRGAALQLAEQGVHVLLIGRHQDKLDLALQEDTSGNLQTSLNQSDIAGFFGNSPKVIGLFVPAGQPIVDTLASISTLLRPGDIILDFSNNLESASVQNQQQMHGQGYNYYTCGISGGEHGARHGAAIMWSGPSQHKDLIEPILTKLCASSHHGPAIGYFGEQAQGHMVKTMHNGIEYTLLAILGELFTYGKQCGATMEQFFRDITPPSCQGYLTDLAARVCSHYEGDTLLIDKIRDQAGQKGTGQYALIQACAVSKPFVGIATALSARYSSANQGPCERTEHTAELLSATELQNLLEHLYVLAHIEGLEILYASGIEDYQQLATTWSAGCILSGNMLDTLLSLLEPGKPPLHSSKVTAYLHQHHMPARKTALAIAASHIPTTIMSLLGSIETQHTRPMYTNFVQAMRDAFGGHTFERIDQPGTFHHIW